MIYIIMPAYNAEKTIEYAIKSVQKQTYKDWILIIVNDGSSDSTSDIINSYTKNDDRIVHLKQKNFGQFVARRNGVQYAKSISNVDDYVCFLDADDSFTSSALEKMYSVAKKDNIDILCAGYQKVYSNKNPRVVFGSKPHIMDEICYENDDILGKLYINFYSGGQVDYALWAKLFEINIIHKAFEYNNFPQRYAEDLVVDLIAFSNAKSVKLINEVVYNYSKGGLTEQFMPTFFSDICIVDSVRSECIKRLDLPNDFTKASKYQFMNLMLSYLERCIHQYNMSVFDLQIIFKELIDDFQAIELFNYESQSKNELFKSFSLAMLDKNFELAYSIVDDIIPPNSFKARAKRLLGKFKK